MVSAIKGITVVLYDLAQIAVDDFNSPVYQETAVHVENVLVTPAATAPITGDLQLNGKRVEYELSIPKDDTNDWENRVVEFFGCKWKTVGFPQEWIKENVPLDWNRKVLVERYG